MDPSAKDAGDLRVVSRMLWLPPELYAEASPIIWQDPDVLNAGVLDRCAEAMQQMSPEAGTSIDSDKF